MQYCYINKTVLIVMEFDVNIERPDESWTEEITRQKIGKPIEKNSLCSNKNVNVC